MVKNSQDSRKYDEFTNNLGKVDIDFYKSQFKIIQTHLTLLNHLNKQKPSIPRTLPWLKSDSQPTKILREFNFASNPIEDINKIDWKQIQSI